MVTLALRCGKNIIPVVEKFSELESIVKHAEELDVRPVIGVRVKLASRVRTVADKCGLPLQVRAHHHRGA